MRLLLDAQLDPAVAAALRRRGFDATSVLDVDRQGLTAATDDEVLSRAVAEHRAVVTRNLRDFLALHRARLAAERRHWGLVFIHSRSIREGDRGAEVQALAALLRRFPEDDALADTIHWLNRKRRGRSEPDAT